ncbi:MAG: response regulator [Bacilli bacterium]|nr:response regulator [Bacilli bacterium]
MRDVNILKNNGVDIEKALESLGDMEMYDDTISEFLNEVNNKLDDIKKYKDADDMPNYAILVHSLKSDARYLGFTKLAELAYDHELKSKENDVNYVNANYDSLIAEANRIIVVAKSYVGNNVETVEVAATNTLETPTAKKTILVADDSTIIRNFIQKVFDDTYDVRVATDGVDVISVVTNDSDNIAAMLLDLNMPNVNGYQVLEYFKENNLFNKIPVSIITGDDAKNTVENAFKYPIVDVLTKPFNENDVKRVVEKTVQLKSN